MTMKDSGNKDQIVKLRVSGAERDMFEAKAANYGSISAMIRDAVAHAHEASHRVDEPALSAHIEARI